jgi:hypothetical protein
MPRLPMVTAREMIIIKQAAIWFYAVRVTVYGSSSQIIPAI